MFTITLISLHFLYIPAHITAKNEPRGVNSQLFSWCRVLLYTYYVLCRALTTWVFVGSAGKERLVTLAISYGEQNMSFFFYCTLERTVQNAIIIISFMFVAEHKPTNEHSYNIQ